MEFNKDLIAENEKLKNTVNQLQNRCQQMEADLKHRIEIEDQLKESRERFATIFHQTNVAHKIINDKLEILELNDAMADLLGYSKEEIIGTKILDYTHPDFRTYWQDLQVALWKRQLDHFDLEACLYKKDGGQVWVIVHTILFKDQGNTFGYTLLEDITNRKNLERHKDDFISVISHELKTPMTSLKAQCQVMVRHLRKYEDGDSDKMMEVIDKQVNRLTRLINNLVLVSKIESSNLQPEIHDYRLDRLVKEVVEEIGLSAPKRHINIDIEDVIPIKGDSDKIYQVVYNLLTNALKFSANNTTVDVTVKKHQEWAIVCIQDHGKGIPKESLERIFERFYKVKTNSSNIESGVGLGLYISSEIVSHQNGKLWVNSEPDKGSTFCFNLPLLQIQT